MQFWQLYTHSSKVFCRKKLSLQLRLWNPFNESLLLERFCERLCVHSVVRFLSEKRNVLTCMRDYGSWGLCLDVVRLSLHPHSTRIGWADRTIAIGNDESVAIGGGVSVCEVWGGEGERVRGRLRPPLDDVGREVGGVTGEGEGIFRDLSHRERMGRKNCGNIR